jgi:hypothetical protein
MASQPDTKPTFRAFTADHKLNQVSVESEQMKVSMKINKVVGI